VGQLYAASVSAIALGVLKHVAQWISKRQRLHLVGVSGMRLLFLVSLARRALCDGVRVMAVSCIRNGPDLSLDQLSKALHDLLQNNQQLGSRIRIFELAVRNRTRLRMKIGEEVFLCVL